MTTASESDGDAGAQREGDVLDAVVTLVDSVLQDFDVVELLTQLTERCVQVLDVAAAGLLLAGPTRQLQLMAATSAQTRELELLQLQSDQGPCLDCYATGQSVAVTDLAVQGERWPRFAESAARAGFASVHAIPMRAAGLVLGALGLFGTTAGPLSSADLAVGQTLAHIATVAIVQERAPSRTAVLPTMRNALASRVVVEQAKGFLRARLGLTVDDAFTLLRRYSEEHGLHLTDVARALISDRDTRPIIVAAISALRTADQR